MSIKQVLIQPYVRSLIIPSDTDIKSEVINSEEIRPVESEKAEIFVAEKTEVEQSNVEISDFVSPEIQAEIISDSYKADASEIKSDSEETLKADKTEEAEMQSDSDAANLSEKTVSDEKKPGPDIMSYVNMGLSVYVHADVPDTEKTRMQIVSPDSALSWDFIPNKVDYSGISYLGSSSISMPVGCLLPKGEWKLTLIYKDGRTVEHGFKVDYRDVEQLYKDVETNGGKTFFSSSTNLTFIP